MTMPWQQAYNPLGSAFASTVVAAIPIVVLLGCIASGRVKAHFAALIEKGAGVRRDPERAAAARKKACQLGQRDSCVKPKAAT